MLQEYTIIIALFCAIAEKLADKDKRHPLAKLYLSEIILCGVLFVLKGSSFRQFYTWLKRRNLLNLPERTRLQRLLIKYRHTCNRFLSDPTLFNVMDSFGIEIIHPIREGRSEQSRQVSKKGKSNYRWVVGRKINLAINGNLEVIGYQDETANVCDNHFNKHYRETDGIMLADNGYREKAGAPDNFKICQRGTWNERMLAETLFSLWTRICKMKYSFHRTIEGFKAKVAYLVTLTSLVFSLNPKLGFNKLSMVQWAL